MSLQSDSLHLSLLFFSTLLYSSFFFFNDTATTEIYTLSLHDALPIFTPPSAFAHLRFLKSCAHHLPIAPGGARSEEHTSELQSRVDLVCRLLLEKKKNNKNNHSQSKLGKRK